MVSLLGNKSSTGHVHAINFQKKHTKFSLLQCLDALLVKEAIFMSMYVFVRIYIYVCMYVYMCKDAYAKNGIVSILNATDAM